jgi:Trk K+ transport system NAD-binding subunit
MLPMQRSQKRLLLLIAALPVLVLITAVLYMLGMELLEGQHRTFWEAVQWSAGTISTTGYGPDTFWHHPGMALYVVAVQFVGVFLIFLLVPVYLIPFLEERFEPRLPTASSGLSGHVVLYRFGAAVAMLVEELERAGVPALIIEEDEPVARRLHERGHQVVLGLLEDGVLGRVQLDAARGVVANGTDDRNAALILGARQAGFRRDILALVEEPFHRKPMMLAGATAAYTPRHILGAALAAHASAKINPHLANVHPLGRHLQIGEVRLGKRSSLVGRTLAEADLQGRSGARVLGQWHGGRLQAPLDGDAVLSSDGSLVVIGTADSLEALSAVCTAARPRQSGPFVVGGFGEVGQKVVELLRDLGEEVVVVDRQSRPGVDVAGNMLDHAVLSRLPLATAQSVVLALDSDSATLFATVIVKDLAPDVPVIARVNQSENVERIHRAGADFALSISQVSGEMLAHRLLGEEAVTVAPRLRVKRVAADPVDGKRVRDLGLGEGVLLVALERGEEVMLEWTGDQPLAAGDGLYVCGATEALRGFEAGLGSGGAGVVPGVSG